jgi:carbon storage regulator
MLILTRRYGESILIGKDIRVTVTRIDEFKQQSTQLGIAAPRSTPILRGELGNAIITDAQALASIHPCEQTTSRPRRR